MILSNDVQHTKSSYRGSTAKKLGVPIISTIYLLDCIDRKECLEIGSYIVLNEEEKLEKGRIGKDGNLP